MNKESRIQLCHTILCYVELMKKLNSNFDFKMSECFQRFKLGAMLGGTVGGTMGMLLGSYAAIRYHATMIIISDMATGGLDISGILANLRSHRGECLAFSWALAPCFAATMEPIMTATGMVVHK